MRENGENAGVVTQLPRAGAAVTRRKKFQFSSCSLRGGVIRRRLLQMLHV